MAQALEALSKVQRRQARIVITMPKHHSLLLQESQADRLSLPGQLLGKLSLGGRAEWAVDVFMPFLLHHVADRYASLGAEST